MLTLNQYLKLELGDQIRFSKGVFTVEDHVDQGTHVECVLVSDDGVKLHNGIYITHLMAYHGQVEVKKPEKRPEATKFVVDAINPRELAMIELYEAAEAI